MTPVPDHPMSRRTLLRAAGTAGLATAGAAALGTGRAGAALSPVATAAAPAGSSRTDALIDTGWRFHLGDVPGAEAPGFDDSGWTPVELPHTWNGIDGAQGGGYYRGPGWYRLPLQIPAAAADRRIYLQFDGACLVSDVWLNGQYVGHHDGGYAGFRFDVTGAAGAAAPGGTVMLAVRVDNAGDPDVAPLTGDFTVEGGLYRPAHLVVADPVHIDLLDYGGPGVYVRQQPAGSAAELEVTVRVTNDSGQAAPATVSVAITGADGRPAAGASTDLTVDAGETTPVNLPVRITDPHLWDGVSDPYLYQVRAEVSSGKPQPSGPPGQAGPRGDAVTVPLGIRTFSVDPDQGFFLNGKPYRLHGVDTHQTARPGKGVAVSAAEVDADYAMIHELGATVVRMAHYQHSQREYENCDQLGIVVWTEVPLVNAVTETGAFTANAIAQMRELIRQTYNNPSVVFRGLGNEQRTSDAYVNQLLTELAALVHAEDPGRLTTYAHCCLSDTDPITGHSDVIGYNRYYGWYTTPLDGLGPWADGLHAEDPGRRIGVSEYGAGASPIQHEQNPAWPVTGSTWHPEEWQAEVHETSWRELQGRPFVWGSFAWVMFDLPSDGRNEGDRPGINDKGLVTLDRSVRKDAFYWYQANWSPEPAVHITSARDTPRFTETADVKVYANTDIVELQVNGISAGTRKPDGCIARWQGIPLRPGLNIVQATGRGGGRTVTDTAVWERDAMRPDTSAAIDCGSPVPYTDGSGRVWVADHDVSPSPAGRTTAAISGTPDPALYQTYRHGYFAYRIPLANGTYQVTLKFTEPQQTASQQRIFNINAQRARALTNLDIYAEAGRNAALDKTINVTVTGGLLDLEFVPQVGDAIVSAIEVIATT